MRANTASPARSYTVEVPLVVPDGATLQGAGAMDFDDQGLPVGFLTRTATIIAKPNLNFASGGKVTIKLKRNDIRGPLDVIGGLSRPDAVVGATTRIISRGNRYSGSGSDAAAWQIVGGSGPPSEAGPKSNSDSNSASVELRDDRIEGFQVGIVAFGGLRLSSDGGTCSYNEVSLRLLHMTLATRPQ